MTYLFLLVNFSLSPIVLFLIFLALRRPLRATDFFARWAVGDVGAVVVALLEHYWSAALAWGASGVLALILWWWSRRKRRKPALRQLGNKARARLAAMVRNMPRPGPVLRPVPQGGFG